MDRIFSIIPKWFLATAVIGGGIAFLVISNPPHTVCESQIEVFQDAQKRFLFVDKVKKTTIPAKYRMLVDHCKITNNPGGCYELFQEMKIMLKDSQSVPSDCASTWGDLAEVKKSLWEVEELLLRLAWGEKPPTTYYQKFGWLDTADVSLYCQLKTAISRTYGEESWDQFREKMFKELKGADKMSRNEIWDMTLYSENCARYP
jgi:hypothetical protein